MRVPGPMFHSSRRMFGPRVVRRLEWPEPVMTIPSPPPPQLFDIERDPLESEDVATRYPGRVASMCLALENWFEDVERERVGRSDHYEPLVRRL